MVFLNSQTGKITKLALAVTLAAIIGYIESLFPIYFLGIPGIKLGFANIVSLIILYEDSFRDALIVCVLRVVLVSFMFGNMYSLIYSLTGGLLSIVIMNLLKKTSLFTITGVSAAGGVVHNIGQMFVAIVTVKQMKIIYYTPALSVTGVVTGVAVGILANLLIGRITVLNDV